MGDLPPATRDRLADLFAAAPAAAGTKAYVLSDVTGLTSRPNVKATVESVANMRVGDVLKFMEYYDSKESVSSVTNQPVLLTKLRTEVAASHARGDSSAAMQRVIDRTVDEAVQSQDALEGNSFFAYGAFRLKIESSKWGELAKSGVLEEKELEFSERGVEVNTVEWKKHTGSREEWMDYSRDLKGNFRTYRRFGLVNQLTAFNDDLDTMQDWEVCRLYINLYFKEYRGRMPKAKCSDTYLLAVRKSGGPLPAALMPPNGAMVHKMTRGGAAGAAGGLKELEAAKEAPWGDELSSLVNAARQYLTELKAMVSSFGGGNPPPREAPAKGAPQPSPRDRSPKGRSGGGPREEAAPAGAPEEEAETGGAGNRKSRRAARWRALREKLGYVSDEKWKEMNEDERAALMAKRVAARKAAAATASETPEATAAGAAADGDPGGSDSSAAAPAGKRQRG